MYSWGAGGSLQLGHGSKVNEEVPRLVESLREVRKLGGGSSAEHAGALASDADGMDGEGDEDEEDELHEVEDQLDKVYYETSAPTLYPTASPPPLLLLLLCTC